MPTATAHKPAPAKTARASKKSTLPAHETHGAIAPSPVNMDKLFGIKSEYNGVETIQDYSTQLKTYSTTELRAHAHGIGVVPMDPREKLMAVLERRFLEKQSKALPVQFKPTVVNAGGEDFIKKFMAGETR